MDHYEVLEVPKSASKEQIKRAYRKRAAKAHPDRGGDKVEFQALQLAFDVLHDDGRRRRYDETGTDRQAHPLSGIAFVMSGVIEAVFNGLAAEGRDADGEDVVELMRSVIKNEMAEMDKALKALRKIETQLSKFLKRFRKRKGDDGLMAGVVGHKLKEKESQIGGLEAQRAAFKEAFDYLRDCEFTYEQLRRIMTATKWTVAM